MNSKLLDDPTWFPHSLTRTGVVFVHASDEALRQAAFLDGREIFSHQSFEVSYDNFNAAAKNWPSRPAPTILHVSFCRSTLLSKLIEEPEKAVIYREPAIYIELSNWLANGFNVREILRNVTKAIARPRGKALAITKPTSWSNRLIHMWSEEQSILPIYVIMKRRPFLTAVFRGGRDRISYTLRLAQHIAPDVCNGQKLIAAAISSTDDTLSRAARLSLLALNFQYEIFLESRKKLQLTMNTVMDESDIKKDPIGTVEKISGIFNVDVKAKVENLAMHAKSPETTFSGSSEAQVDKKIEDIYGVIFDEALDWLKTQELEC